MLPTVLATSFGLLACRSLRPVTAAGRTSISWRTALDCAVKTEYIADWIAQTSLENGQVDEDLCYARNQFASFLKDLCAGKFENAGGNRYLGEQRLRQQVLWWG